MNNEGIIVAPKNKYEETLYQIYDDLASAILVKAVNENDIIKVKHIYKLRNELQYVSFEERLQKMVLQLTSTGISKIHERDDERLAFSLNAEIK